MRIRVLGGIELISDADATLGGPTQRRLLALLAMRSGDVVPIDRLVDLTWPDGDEPARAAHNIRTYVHRIRQALGSEGRALETVEPGYRLDLACDQLDAMAFEHHARIARSFATEGDHAAALGETGRALDLWRGRPYDEFADEDWARAEVTRLNEIRLELIERRASLLVGAGRSSEAVAELEAAIAAEPMRDGLRAQLMMALYHGGRQADALRAFQNYRRFLHDEAGVDPSPQLVELDRTIASGTLPEPRSGPVAIRGAYEIHERIGSGAFAEVFRGTQPALGREVAIKIVRAELANRPDFIRGFEAEAAMVARLEHPHIVPLYDFWREPDRALLVMRWLTGGSLEASLDDGPWSVEATARMVEQVGSALALAHRAGVVHRDVKSANILLDDDGNAYLTDFGIAVDAGGPENPAAALSEGSPAYASPEQLRRDEVGPAADIHGLGITLYEMLAGKLPFAGVRDKGELLRRQLYEPIPSISAQRADVPVGIDMVLATATAKDPGARYATVSEFVQSFIDNLAAGPGASAELRDAAARVTAISGALDNPYKGLRSFDEGDAGEFHGRERLVDELIANLGDETVEGRFVAVVGPSGSGKSSVVRAGLVPALRAGAIEGSSDWFITTMTPGLRPYEALETALLRIAVNPPESLRSQLREDRRGILRACRRILPTDDATVLVVVDQFEEVFSAEVDAGERAAFLEGLAVAATDPSSPVRVVVTLRADFYDQPLRHAEISGLVKNHTVSVTPLAPDELERAIVSPAAGVGARFEPGLVAEITADVASQPGALPLMQYALSQLFEARVSGLLTVAAYRELGGLQGALAQRSEELYQSLDDEGRIAAHHVFGRLVTLGRGTEDTRRRVPRSELGTDAATDSVLDAFGKARLLMFDHDATTREPSVEVAHEALIREWPRLRGWLDEDRELLHVLRGVTHGAQQWDADGRRESDLFRGGRLDAAATLLVAPAVDLSPVERAFVLAGLELRDREQMLEQRRARRLRALTVAASIIAVIAIIAGALAISQRRRADDEAAQAARNAEAAEAAAREADANAAAAQSAAQDAEAAALRADLERMMALARNADPVDPRVGILLAVESHRADPSFETLDALHYALTARPEFVGALPTGGEIGGDISVLDDGEHLVVHTQEAIQLWNVPDRVLVNEWPSELGFAEPQWDLRTAVAGDGSLVAATRWTETRLFDPASGDLVDTIDHGDVDPGLSVAFSPDGALLAIGRGSGVIQIFDVSDEPSPLVTQSPPLAGPVSELRWHPDGTALAAATREVPVVPGSRDTVAQWEIGAEQPSWVTDGFFLGLLFSSDGERLVMSRSVVSNNPNEQGGDLLVVDPADGSQVDDPIPLRLGSIDWWDEAQARVVAQTGTSGALSVIDLGSRSVVDTISPDLERSGGGSDGAVAVLRELGVVATPGLAGVELRDLDGTGPLARLAPLPPEVQANPGRFLLPAFDADGPTFVASTLFDEVPPFVYRFDEAGGGPVPWAEAYSTSAPYAVQSQASFTAQLTPDGVVVRMGLDGDPVGPALPLHDLGLTTFRAVSPTGDRFAQAEDGTVVLYDTASGDVVARIRDELPWNPDLDFSIVEFSADGARLQTWSGIGSAQFDARTGELLWATDEFGWGFPLGDPRLIATPEESGAIVLRNAATREVQGAPLLGHTGLATQIYGDPANPRLVVSAGRDGVSRVWDLEQRAQLGRELPTVLRSIRRWSPDGRTLANPGSKGFELWNYDTETWADIACEVASRNLTPEEWEQVGPRSWDYRATCDQYPLG